MSLLHEEIEEIERLFSYHVSKDKVPLFEKITSETKRLAYIYSDCIPAGKDRDTALYHLRMARMMANAGIACGKRIDE